MAMAASITEASRLSYVQMNIKRGAATLKADLLGFITTVNTLFPDEIEPQRSIGNWLIPLSAIQSQMQLTPGAVLIDVFNQAVDVVARICWAALTAQGGGRITAGQATAFLAAWNTAFGT